MKFAIPEDLVGAPHLLMRTYIEAFNRALVRSSKDPDAAGRSALIEVWNSKPSQAQREKFFEHASQSALDRYLAKHPGAKLKVT